MTKTTILLTGANGFLGSHLLDTLLKLNYLVVVLKRSTSDISRIEHLTNQYVSYDIDVQSIDKAFEENSIDCVIHTACHYGRNNDSLSNIVKSNIVFGLEVLEAALSKNVKTFINTDSFSPIELNAYSLSKKQFIYWLQKYSSNIKIINLKIEHMYGPGDDENKFIPWLISQLEQNINEIKLTSGVQKRDFIFIDDIINAFILILHNQDLLSQYIEFEVGTGKSTEVRLIVEFLKNQYEKIIGKSDTQLSFGAISYRDGELMEYRVDNKSLINFGWKPSTNIYQGIQKTLHAYKYNKS